MKKRNIKLIFFLVIVVFFTELFLALNFTEPFPAIIYPSFSDIPSVNSTIKKAKIIVFFNDLDSLEIDKKEFLHNLPDVYSNVILNENFKNESSFLTAVKEVRTLNATVGTRQINIGLEEVGNERHIQEGKNWVLSNLRKITKREDFNRVEIQWYDYQLTKDEEEPLKQGDLADRYILHISDEYIDNTLTQ